MDLTLCGQSAFYYYRIPPQVLGLYPAISLGNIDRRCCGLGSHAVVKDLLHAPLHRLVFTRAQSGSRSLFKSHLLTKSRLLGRLGRLNMDLMSLHRNSRCSALLRRSPATSYSWLATRCAAHLQCLRPANVRNSNLMRQYLLSSFRPTVVGSVLSTPRAMTPTCGNARRSSARRISPRSPSRPQACAVLSSSAGPPNAWQGRPPRPSRSRRPCSSHSPATKAVWV